ncbi:hypothetical protein EX30DRAFT_199684 [Ascodesmis nigricans]|uniref:DUF676 domain-containing protein n=1 Tax=Ascodesmis nigricans TaxID=341454 RepID=A0A4S2MKF4_9PEZI|nr:hypothetical protein EX30DRAFT_199684 [Ascodesmis nigricans]
MNPPESQPLQTVKYRSTSASKSSSSSSSARSDPERRPLIATPPLPLSTKDLKILAVSSPYISQDGEERRRCYFTISPPPLPPDPLQSTKLRGDDKNEHDQGHEHQQENADGEAATVGEGDRTTTTLTTTMPQSKEPEVSYIPSQLHTPAAADPVMLRLPPLRLLWEEAKLVTRELPYFVGIFWGKGKKGDPEGELKIERKGNVWSMVLQVVVFGYSVVAVVLGMVLGIVLPCWVMAVYYAVMGVGLWTLCRGLNYGPRILHSQVDLRGFPQRPEERWLFVNGICAGTQWLQDNIDSIATIFGRHVTGVHNTTYGVLWDLVECLIQRDFLYSTEDTRLTYNYIKTTLLDPSVKRVVIMAHSQGGIIVSSVIDALYADLMPEAFDKLEIYTFGCAATRFCNPPRPLTPSESGLTPPTPTHPRQIAAIEHYVNDHDYVARIGVLHFVRGKPRNQYVGRVFTRLNVGGHLFNQHYLQNMFAGERPEFLEAVVRVEDSVAVKRAAVEGDEELGVVRGSRQAQEAVGKRVRELSRLWLYKDGNVPPPIKIPQYQDDETPSLSPSPSRRYDYANGNNLEQNHDALVREPEPEPEQDPRPGVVRKLSLRVEAEEDDEDEVEVEG